MKNAFIVFVVALTAVILLTGFWPEVSTNVLPNTTWGLYSRPFFSDLLISLHGNLVDLFVVGIVLYGFEQKRLKREQRLSEEAQRNNSIARNMELLEDLRHYKGEDAAFRTLNVFRRLINLEYKYISCPNADLGGVKIHDLQLPQAKLPGANFSGSKISGVNLERANLDGADFSAATLVNLRLRGASLRRAKFTNARLDGIDFRGCEIERADFTGASLRSAIFSGCDCKGIKLDATDLTHANFIGAKNLPKNFPVQAKKIKHLKVIK